MHYRSLAVNMSNKGVGDSISLETQTIILTSGLLNVLWASRKGPLGGLATLASVLFWAELRPLRWMLAGETGGDV